MDEAALAKYLDPLKDPHAVYVNILKGTIAKVHYMNLGNLYTRQELEKALELRIAKD